MTLELALFELRQVPGTGGAVGVDPAASHLVDEGRLDNVDAGVDAGDTVQFLLPGHVMATKKPLVVEDVTENELISPARRLNLKEHGFHGRASVPLLANDRSIGVLAVMDKRIRHFTEDEVAILTAFADQAALALEKARLLKEAETQKELAETERERADSLYR
ncbi:MAG: GAF domain-containing protein, partial [Chloroflexi bacterium]|nr:GAF domain-containing protein [Chloroflexota bacterium]